VEDVVGLPVPLADLALQVTGDAGRARAQFSSSLAAGALDVPASPHEPWQGRFDYLRLPARARSEPPGEAPQQASAPALSPADLPALQLAIEQLYTGDGLLGSAELRLAPTPQGVALRRLRLHGPAVELTASGSWTRTAEGDSTQLELASRSGAIARFMRTLGQAVPLEAEHSEATLAAQWPAAPWGFDATRARGRLSLTLTDGYIYAAEDTSDAMMLLFSLYALPRRLNEDLGDIFRSSMAFDQIIHLAARAGVRPSLENPALYQRVNVEGTVNVLEAARERGVKKITIASSSSVYGVNSKVPFSEADPIFNAISPYAASKLGCEALASLRRHWRP
jgi:uncharacterized protein YhdP